MECWACGKNDAKTIIGVSLRSHKGGDVDLINNPLHVPEGPITRSKAKKIQEAFTLHVQKLANTQRKAENIEPKFFYNVSSTSQEEIEVKMARKKLCSLEDGIGNKKSVQNLWRGGCPTCISWDFVMSKVVKRCHYEDRIT